MKKRDWEVLHSHKENQRQTEIFIPKVLKCESIKIKFKDQLNSPFLTMDSEFKTSLDYFSFLTPYSSDQSWSNSSFSRWLQEKLSINMTSKRRRRELILSFQFYFSRRPNKYLVSHKNKV